MKDALGNPLVVGNAYGYTQSKSGWNYVIIGRLEKINKDKVTLTDVQEKIYSYSELHKEFRKQEGKRSIRAFHLFPIILPE